MAELSVVDERRKTAIWATTRWESWYLLQTATTNPDSFVVAVSTLMPATAAAGEEWRRSQCVMEDCTYAFHGRGFEEVIAWASDEP